MKEKTILVVTLVSLSMVGFVRAQEGELHGAVDLTYQSKYVWRGFNVFGDKSAIEASVDLDLYGTGFGCNLTGHRANSSGYENFERWDYTLYYRNKLFQDETYATDYMVAWRYYNYPDNSSGDIDLQEAHALLSWPKICPAGFIPRYCLVKLWPSESGSLIGGGPPSGTASGWAHILMVDYPMTIPGILPETPEQVLNWHSELVFNDGVHPVGGDVDHDWSNFVLGASTDFDLGNNMTLTPGLYYQIAMEETVNDDDDQLWATVGVKYKF